ncbi:hypothetical protein SUGI_0674500 [Cryptomeria japonica]|nr:hypothetical protein SUGI_0674500 [Cryptomeria japonica]
MVPGRELRRGGNGLLLPSEVECPNSEAASLMKMDWLSDETRFLNKSLNHSLQTGGSEITKAKAVQEQLLRQAILQPFCVGLLYMTAPSSDKYWFLASKKPSVVPSVTEHYRALRRAQPFAHQP